MSATPRSDPTCSQKGSDLADSLGPASCDKCYHDHASAIIPEPRRLSTHIVVHRSRDQERTQTNIGCKRSSLDLSNASARFFHMLKNQKAHLVSRRRIAEPDERPTCNHARQHMNRLFRWRRRRSYRKSKCLPTPLIFH